MRSLGMFGDCFVVQLVAVIKDKIFEVQAPCVAFVHDGLRLAVTGGDR